MTYEAGQPTSVAALTPEWHELRRTRICATDWPKILLRPEQWSGSPFGSPLSVWEKLTGKRTEDVEAGLHLQWGHYNEPMHAAWLADEAGVAIERCGVSWIRGERFEASPDGFVSGARDGSVELKAPTPWSPPWEDAAPLQYKVQSQAVMWVTGVACSITSSLVFPGPPRFEWMDYDERNVERWLEVLNDFWDRHVATDSPPPTTSSDRDRKILDRMRGDGGVTVTMPPDIEGLCVALNEADERGAVFERRSKAYRNQLRQWMVSNSASRAVSPDGTIAWSYSASGLRRAKTSAAAQTVTPEP